MMHSGKGLEGYTPFDRSQAFHRTDQLANFIRYALTMRDYPVRALLSERDPGSETGDWIR